MQFYFFHVYNVEEIKAGQKPFVAERGPYTYRCCTICHCHSIGVAMVMFKVCLDGCIKKNAQRVCSTVTRHSELLIKNIK